MIAKQEIREYKRGARVYLAHYKNLNNVLHWHDDCELVYVQKGTLEVFVRGTCYSLNAGDLLYVGNMEEHSIRTRTEADVYMIIFSAELLRGTLSRLQLKSPVLKGDYGFSELYETLKGEFLRGGNFSKEISETIVYLRILSIFREEEVTPSAFKQKDKLLFMGLLEDIDKNYAYYSAEMGASFLCVSKVYFSKYFHKMSGMTFVEYLNGVRIGKAIELLFSKKERTVTEISTLCGFNSIRNFNYAFKKATGYSPSALPEDFTLDELSFRVGSPDPKRFNPTLHETVLLESFG